LVSIQGKIGAVTVGLFVLFGDKILAWYIGLPWQVTWSGVGVVGVFIIVLKILIRKWPSKIRAHREALRKGLDDIRFALFSFVFVGVSDVFYKLDLFLFSFYTYPGPWLMLGVQVFFLVNLAGLQYDQLNLGAKMVDGSLVAVRKLIRRYRQRCSERGQ